MKRSHPARDARLPRTPDGGRPGQLAGESQAGGGAEGGFEVPIRAWNISVVALLQLPWALIAWALAADRLRLSTPGTVALGLGIVAGVAAVIFLLRRSVVRHPHFWALAPYLLAFAAGMPFLIPEYTLFRAILVAGLSGTALALFLAMAAPRRFWWCMRVVAAAVFLAYAAYAVDMWFIEKRPVRFDEPASKASPMNALRGLLAFGIPSLVFLLSGRGRVFSMLSRRGNLKSSEEPDGGPGDSSGPSSRAEGPRT